MKKYLVLYRSTLSASEQMAGATLNLPDGQADGWFRDSDGTVHVLTRHLTYFALVGQQVHHLR